MEKNSAYCKGYIAGYRDGIKDAFTGKNRLNVESDITALPIITMNLSTRAYNCLFRAGCRYVADVITMSEDTIRTTRNMGSKCAAEIALWLDRHGIRYTAWSKFV